MNHKKLIMLLNFHQLEFILQSTSIIFFKKYLYLAEELCCVKPQVK